jgi:hypothetical protein
MALYATRTLTGRGSYDLFLNGAKVASGGPATAPPSGMTTTAASADVTGPAAAFTDVAEGDRIFISGIDDEFVVDAKTSNTALTLNKVVPVTLLAHAGVWRAHRGERVSPADIVLLQVDLDAGPRYHATYKLTEFAP